MKWMRWKSWKTMTNSPTNCRTRRDRPWIAWKRARPFGFGHRRAVSAIRLAVDRRQHRVDAVVDAAIEIAALKLRLDDGAGDPFRFRVGQRSFQAVADLDAHLSIAGEDEQNRTVV